jgi:NTE family protein
MSIDLTSKLHRPTFALALGGGGARGLTHILVLEALDELGIKPVAIAGTSIGALYGAGYASGLSAAQLRAHTEETLGRRLEMIRQLIVARSEPVQKLLKFVPLRSALLNPETLLDQILPSRLAKDFASLQIPLKIVATDLGTYAPAILSEGPLRPAVAASIAIPLVFSPVTINGTIMADGGLTNPLPFDLIDDLADVTIAVDVGGPSGSDDLSPRRSIFDVAIQSIHIMQKSITQERLRYRQPDIYVDAAVGHFNALEFYRSAEIFEAAAQVKSSLKGKLDAILSGKSLA